MEPKWICDCGGLQSKSASILLVPMSAYFPASKFVIVAHQCSRRLPFCLSFDAHNSTPCRRTSSDRFFEFVYTDHPCQPLLFFYRVHRALQPQTLPPWVADARGVSLVSALCAPAHSSRVEMYPQSKPPVTVSLAKLYCSSVTCYVYLRFQQRSKTH
ncbi:hypothetical protein RRG08_040447 [Elysia crispata]|uniref:Uncharacterized protein n=1 Tax=Elysia crispata TaxID=231223 RepID=A0AAE0ZCI2_9GAST|nr:hypothetical protein RRG08_040447 [Elysia crispata]